MRASVLAVVAIGTGILWAGCGGETEAERAARYAAMTPMEQQVQTVLDKRCIKCHMPPDPEAKLNLMHPEYLLPLLSSERLFDDIAVYVMLLGDTTLAEHRRDEARITFDEIALIRDWVLTEHQEMFADSSDHAAGEAEEVSAPASGE